MPRSSLKELSFPCPWFLDCVACRPWCSEQSSQHHYQISCVCWQEWICCLSLQRRELGRVTGPCWGSSCLADHLYVASSVLLTCGLRCSGGVEYRGWGRLTKGNPSMRLWGSHHPCSWKLSSVAALGSPMLLPATPHPCCVRKLHKLIVFP